MFNFYELLHKLKNYGVWKVVATESADFYKRYKMLKMNKI